MGWSGWAEFRNLTPNDKTTYNSKYKYKYNTSLIQLHTITYNYIQVHTITYKYIQLHTITYKYKYSTYKYKYSTYKYKCQSSLLTQR